MIARSHRFHGHASLNSVYRRAQTVRGPLMSLKYAPRHRGGYRAAIVVSRKVSKSAVVRNRIRRRLYECMRQHEAELAAPYDLIFTVFSDQLATMEAPALDATLVSLLTKAGIMGINSGTDPDRHDIVKRTEE